LSVTLSSSLNFFDSISPSIHKTYLRRGNLSFLSLDKKINLSVYEFIQFQKNKKSCAIAAISEPDRFFKSLDQTAILYQDSIGLPDHHPFDLAFFNAQQADLLLITTKDAVKCRALHDPRVWVIETTAIFSDPRWVTSLTKQLIRHARSHPE
jgi:tetraacyldisaccharide-1-P 4'-kinase